MISVTDSNGILRWMGNNPAPLKTSWAHFGANPTTTLIPRDQWKSLVDALPGGNSSEWPWLNPAHDQDGVGQCNADATTGAMESQRSKQGLPYVALSAGDLYDRINGGSDNGSSLEDGLAESVARGVGTVQTYGGDVWSRGRGGCPQEERNAYRVVEAFLCPTFDHCFSAVLQGFDLVSGIMWYDSFNPDNAGWLPSRGAGGGGGHAVHGYKPTYRGDVFGIWHQNSWGRWGLSSNGIYGLCVFPESLYNGPVGGWWAVRQVTDNANDIPGLVAVTNVREVTNAKGA